MDNSGRSGKTVVVAKSEEEGCAVVGVATMPYHAPCTLLSYASLLFLSLFALCPVVIFVIDKVHHSYTFKIIYE